MDRSVGEVAKKYEGKKVDSFEEIQKLYRQKNVKAVSFSSNGAKFYIKKVYMFS